MEGGPSVKIGRLADKIIRELMAWLKLEPWSFDFQDRALFTKKKEKEKRFQMLWTNKLALIVLRIAVQGRGRVMDWETG